MTHPMNATRVSGPKQFIMIWKKFPAVELLQDAYEGRVEEVTRITASSTTTLANGAESLLRIPLRGLEQSDATCGAVRAAQLDADGASFLLSYAAAGDDSAHLCGTLPPLL